MRLLKVIMSGSSRDETSEGHCEVESSRDKNAGGQCIAKINKDVVARGKV
jgi:hypothetical protein